MTSLAVAVVVFEGDPYWTTVSRNQLLRRCVTCSEDRMVVESGLVVRCKDLDKEVSDSTVAVGCTNTVDKDRSADRNVDTYPAVENSCWLELDQ